MFDNSFNLLICLVISNLALIKCDSYFEAYQEAQTKKIQKKSDPIYPNYGQFPQFPQYGPPGPQYGPPTSNYGQYPEPVSTNNFPQIYGPPQNLQVFYGVPHAMISIWDRIWEKIKWKLDLFTLGKIILKIVIFKKFVSFIAILCLLLFIPSLKHKKITQQNMNEQENDFRSLEHNKKLKNWNIS